MTRLLVALGCLLWLPRVLYAQADTTEPGLRLRFAYPPLALQQPAALRAPWMGGVRLVPAARVAAFDSTVSAMLAADRADRLLALRLKTIYGIAEQPPEELGEQQPRRRNLLGLPTKYADLTLDGQARLEIRTDRLREERCTPALSLDPNSGCRGNFKAPSLDNQVNIVSTGLLGQRVHVNVDFDTERDYSSNNNVQIYYEGLQDEIVKRVDVGTVVFQPPASRFITAAVPANNFGVNATFEVGPVQLQTLFATQKGSVVSERTYTVGQNTSQAQDRQARDLDFESGRFFWIVDPDSLPGHPAIDILTVSPNSLTPTYRPSQVRIYRYRAAASKSGVNPNLGGITAFANRPDSPQQFGPGALGAADPGHGLLPGPVGPLDRPGDQARPERLSRRQLSDRGRQSHRHLPRGGPRDRPGRRRAAGAGHGRADRPAAAGAHAPDVPLRDAAGVSRGGRRPRRRLAPGGDHAQPVRASAERERADLLATAGPRGSQRRRGVRPDQPALPAAAGPRGIAGDP